MVECVFDIDEVRSSILLPPIVSLITLTIFNHMQTPSTQALETLKKEMAREDQELQEKKRHVAKIKADTKKKEEEMKREIQRLESEAREGDADIHKRTQEMQGRERELMAMQEELRKIMSKK